MKNIFLSETRDSAFFATLSADVVFEEIHQIIAFDNDKINVKGHYSVTTGRYTALVTGVYQFYAYVRSTPEANFQFFVNEASYANPIEPLDTENNYGEGGVITIRLEAGQRVDVRTGDQPYTVVGNGESSWFGGHLLFPEA